MGCFAVLAMTLDFFANKNRHFPGSGGRIRTGDQDVNSVLRYRCATPDQKNVYFSDVRILYRNGECFSTMV